MLQKVDGRDHVEAGRAERDRPVIDLEHPLAHQLPGRFDVIALEVGAGPGPSPLAQEIGRQAGAAAQLQAGPALERRQVRQQGVHGLPLLERAAEELQLPGLGHAVSGDAFMMGCPAGRRCPVARPGIG